MNCLRVKQLLVVLMVLAAVGCGTPQTPSHPLDQDLARSSVDKAMQAWVDGKTPKDLQPAIVVGDSAWEKGRKLLSFEVLPEEETSDGSNLHIRVKRKFQDGESQVTYIVGTSPVVTIFPQ